MMPAYEKPAREICKRGEQMDIENLVRTIAERIIGMLDKRVLVFISGGAVNLKDIFETLASMDILKYDIVMTKSAEKVIPGKYVDGLNGRLIDCKEEMTGAVRSDDLVLVPVMTRNTLSKCALGIEDNLVTTGIAESLMMNKKVIAVSDSFDPENPRNMSLGLSKNKAYNRLISDYRDNLCSLGVDFIRGDELKGTLENEFILLNGRGGGPPTESRKEDGVPPAAGSDLAGTGRILSHVVTAEDILANMDSREIYIKRDSLVTPLAKDYMDNNNITVKYY
ncbi:flavoprotein [uncultured Clostridium sp.]|uniref:flavoprotein n=1 Tax=uncultured Clostridium sp. TaxID=59620 RepID=UPI0025F88EEC|nr:flavoprotein [uncultured Clostridium sp.]